MDIKPANQQQPVSDDQELAKVLAGIKEKAADTSDKKSTPEPAAEQPAQPAAPVLVPEPAPLSMPAPMPGPSSSPSPELESIKKDALSELRPLVDKLNLPAEEKFDTLLLIIRSTDDQSLLAAAHDAAKSIADETRRATALLDIIKEVDFFANNSGKPAAS